MAFGMTAIMASPWYFISWNEMVTYASQPDFAPHSLGSVVSWYTISTYLQLFANQLGWPLILLFVVGFLWGCCHLIRSGAAGWKDCKIPGLVLLFASGAGVCIAALMTRNLNTRFGVPALIPLAILSGLALDHLLERRRAIIRAAAVTGIGLHLVFWWSLSFGPDLPRAVTVFPQDRDLRPTNIELLLTTVNFVETTPVPSQATFWIVGDYHSFNQPTIVNLVTEHGDKRLVRELYHWNETETDVRAIIDRIAPGEFVAVYRQDREFKSENEKWAYRFDDPILDWLQTHPGSFELVVNQNSSAENGRLWIYRSRGGQ
jgi:hypothetical protein